MSLKEKVLSKLGMDENEDFGLEDIVALILKFEGEPVDRKAFLQEVLQKKYAQEVIDKAISESPVAAGLKPEDLESIARELMEQAKIEVTKEEKKEDLKEALQDEESNILEKAKDAIETLMANRYQQEWSKLSQEVLYLYGFPELDITDDGILNGDTSKLIMMLAAADMFDVENAEEAIKAVARVLPQLNGKAISLGKLDSDDISEVLKKWALEFACKGVVNSVVGNIPVLGGKLISESYADKLEKSFVNLLNTLSDTELSNPQHEADPKELEYAEKLAAIIQD